MIFCSLSLSQLLFSSLSRGFQLSPFIRLNFQVSGYLRCIRPCSSWISMSCKICRNTILTYLRKTSLKRVHTYRMLRIYEKNKPQTFFVMPREVAVETAKSLLVSGCTEFQRSQLITVLRQNGSP